MMDKCPACSFLAQLDAILKEYDSWLRSKGIDPEFVSVQDKWWQGKLYSAFHRERRGWKLTQEQQWALDKVQEYVSRKNDKTESAK